MNELKRRTMDEHPTALLIDDSPELLRALTRILRREKFAVTACATATEALERIERGDRFALVVCDLRMPEMNGMEFRRRVRLVWPEVDHAFAFVSGDSVGGAQEELDGVPRFMKPVDETFVAFLQRHRALIFLRR